MKISCASLLSFFCVLFGEIEYNHPEFNWQTFETEHFKIHFYDETEISAREAASVAEKIYDPITSFYDFYPKEKTHIILTDPDASIIFPLSLISTFLAFIKTSSAERFVVLNDKINTEIKN